MPTFDEYINALEGQENLDPVQIAKDLRQIHTDELSIRDAKIDEQNIGLTEWEEKYATSQSELTAQKAKNFDLAMQVPGTDASQNDDNANTDSDPDGASITIDDLFSKD